MLSDNKNDEDEFPPKQQNIEENDKDRVLSNKNEGEDQFWPYSKKERSKKRTFSKAVNIL